MVQSVGRDIQDAREAKGWSRADLARRMQVTRGLVRFWEVGERTPRVDRLRKLARVLERDLRFDGKTFHLGPKAA